MNFVNQRKERQCRYCGINFTPRPGLSGRFCETCRVVRAREQREKRRRKKERTVERPKIKDWRNRRREGLEPNCLGCGDEFKRDGDVAVDHIVPAAVVAELNKNIVEKLGKEFEGSELKVTVSGGLYDAEAKENLASACRSCHGKKRRAEIRLERADVVGFLAELRRIGYPEERTKIALRLYGLLR